MSKKYVIDIPDDAQYILINGASENHCYTRVEHVDDLEELNSDYINEHYGSLQDEAYQAGMDKAWQLAEDVIYNRGNVLDILNCATVGAAFDKYSAGDAVDILKEYESKQKDRIEVGDEVIASCGKAVVTATNNKFVYYVYSDGNCGANEARCLTKTGKHYDIASILEAMRK